jgi:hypothetical protein
LASCFGGGGGGAARFASGLEGGGGGGVTGLTSGFASVVVVGCEAPFLSCVDVTAGFPGAAGLVSFSSCVVAVGAVSLGLVAPFAFGFTVPGAAVLGAVATGAAGVLPLPGTGSAFSLRNCGWLVVLAGVTVAVPGLAVALIVALCGAGNLPCWISEARCTTLFGGVGAPVAAPAGGAGLLMTLLMTVVLWMLLKMTLFAGGWT